jgi:hypothetical protein
LTINLETHWHKYYWSHRKEISEKARKYRSENSDKIAKWRDNHRSTINLRVRIYREKLKRDILYHYGGNPPKCACCGESIYEFLTIDHIKNNGKEDRKIFHGAQLYAWLRKNNYPIGFQVLCWNCNCAKGHFGECPHVREKR